MNETGDSLSTPIPTPAEPLHPVKQFYRDVIDSLTEPREFFTHRFPKISLSYALAFAILVNWIADFLSWLTRLINHETLLDGLLKMRDKLSELPVWKDLPTNIWAQQQPEHVSMFPNWVAEVLGVALSPFQTLIRVTVAGLFIWVGAYLLVPKNRDDGLGAVVPLTRDQPDVSLVIKIAALAQAPALIGAILGFLPVGLGTVVSGIYGFVLLIFALAVRFRISYLRSFAVVILPGFLFTFVAGCLVTTFGAVLFGIVAALFGGFTK
jgi:hypothetical protein